MQTYSDHMSSEAREAFDNLIQKTSVAGADKFLTILRNKDVAGILERVHKQNGNSTKFFVSYTGHKPRTMRSKDICDAVKAYVGEELWLEHTRKQEAEELARQERHVQEQIHHALSVRYSDGTTVGDFLEQLQGAGFYWEEAKIGIATMTKVSDTYGTSHIIKNKWQALWCRRNLLPKPAAKELTSEEFDIARKLFTLQAGGE